MIKCEQRANLESTNNQTELTAAVTTAGHGSTAEPALKSTSSSTPDRLRGWLHSLTDGGLTSPVKETIQAFEGTRAEAMALVRMLDLPHIPYVNVSVSNFLREPELYLTQLGGTKYYWVLQPSAGDISLDHPDPRVGDSAELIQQARLYAAEGVEDQYILTISQCAQIKYIGNIVVGNQGGVYAEFNKAPLPPTRSNTNPTFTVRGDPYLGTFRYSITDPDIRSAVFRAIQALPSIGAGRERKYLPGYYEVFLATVGDEGLLSARFFDVKQSGPFIFDAVEGRV